MAFEGFELLEFAIKAIRMNVNHVAVTYQSVSYYGNPAECNLEPTLKRLLKDGLIDELIYYEPDLSLPPKENELRLRNIGLNASREAGCTHHISADVDEFYKSDDLEFAKTTMEEGGFDFSIAYFQTYYKEPTFLVTPPPIIPMSFIHPVSNNYKKDNPDFPFRIEVTRKLTNYETYKVFNLDEFAIHHMSYVRKDIRKKLMNNSNKKYYKEGFIRTWANYKLGDRVALLPDFINRKTVQVENQFGIVL